MEKMVFNPGPTALPDEVLSKAKAGLGKETYEGLSLLELSHRSTEYQAIHDNAKQALRRFLNIPATHEVLLLQGGASLQFTMAPMNLLRTFTCGYHIVTGSWSKKAYSESKKIGTTHMLTSSEDAKFSYIPKATDWHSTQLDPDGYVHITSNNTIYGTQWQNFEQLPSLPLVVDMSSDIGTRPIPWEKVALAYAGAQKNLGASGVTAVFIRKDLLSRDSSDLPAMLDYKTHAEKGSLFNTPPTFNIYVLGLMVDWMIEQGGMDEFQKRSEQKSQLLYELIDDSDGFYTGHAKSSSRSQMNVTFQLPDEQLNKRFLESAKQSGFVGLSGHRSIGGCRASLYNGITLEACEKLVEFLASFRRTHTK
ncbi:3-phosphoserine/phosphohydroxythreonine transaminase [Pseudalkalibacillus sp. Hm43]|uniref:3-phosphoserine/phosphohydroxythreonine transaminase n=1 Tax=Pseudalkalibacillus sp. Hm43 TaxID=3450742 RepID=UPI003F4447FC